MPLFYAQYICEMRRVSQPGAYCMKNSILPALLGSLAAASSICRLLDTFRQFLVKVKP